MTLLDVINSCDNFPQHDDADWTSAISRLWQFRLPGDDRPFGYIVPEAVAQMPWTSDFKVDETTRTVHLAPVKREGDIIASSAAAFDNLLETARNAKSFPDLHRWPGEKYTVFGSPFPLAIYRSLAPYLGIVTTGAHLNIYVRSPDGSVAGVWIARRGLSKPLYPGMLDNAAAGCVSHEETPSVGIVREASEELGLDATGAVSAGTISWFNVKGPESGIHQGLVEPGVQYVYDLEVSPDTILRPAEDDIEWLRLLNVEETMAALHRHEFKPSCACVTIDFFVRHGIIRAENEEDFAEIAPRLHRRLPLPVASAKRA